MDLRVPPQGLTAGEIAATFGLPADRIEAVLVNRRAQDLRVVVRLGDRLAFVPQGTPGPHRYTLGICPAEKAGRI